MVFILSSVSDLSSLSFTSHWYAGIILPDEVLCGSYIWFKCQLSEYLPPTLNKSGPVRLLPQRKGWSYTNSPALAYSPYRSVSLLKGLTIWEWHPTQPSRI